MKGVVISALLGFLAILPGKMGAEETGRGPEEPWFEGTRRFGIFIGSNNGGRDRVMLRYAVSDARAVSKVFADMGGIYSEDNLLLIEPSVGEINRRIGAIRDQVAASRQRYKRTELVFYYSGHSDEEGLLLNRERYAYRDLREQINRIPSDMRIVILDSCSSGAFTRAKGGVKTQPFLIDSSLSAEGYAFLSSSSAAEASQESDSIESSYFTHSLVAGLRGAADTIGDGRITLNEAYQFTYAETLAKTETSIYGAQHPSYDMQISGTGDVVLTDIKETSASLVIAPELSGRLSIRDGSDYLVAEITKTGNRSMEIGLEPGLYRVTLQQEGRFYRAELLLEQDGRTSLVMEDFTPITPIPAQVRGDGEEPDETGPGGTGNETLSAGAERIPREPINLQLVPGMGIFGFGARKSVNNFLLGVIGAAGYELQGAALASLGISNAGMVHGLQAAGIYTIAGADIQGLQAAGIFNFARGDAEGLQTAGVFNMTKGGRKGLQAAGVFNMTGADTQGLQAAGIFNMTGADIQGLQTAGVFNLVRGDVEGLQAAGVFNIADDGKGLQAAGIFNRVAGNFRGFQLGGINMTGGIAKALQVGLVNIGGEGRGVQIGLVNISRNEKVVPVGLVNVVKGGMMHPAVFYDDMGLINFSFQSGSKHVYSLLSVGTQRIALGGNDSSWVLGKKEGDRFLVYRFGLGTEFSIGKRFFLDFDLSAGNILNLDTLGREWDGMGDLYDGSFSILSQARLSAGYKVFEHLGVFGGLSYDYIYRHTHTSPNFRGNIDGFVFGWGGERHIHKLGLFGGIRF